MGQDQNSNWFKLSNETWIAAFLVNRVEVGLPVINVPIERANTTPTTTEEEKAAGK